MADHSSVSATLNPHPVGIHSKNKGGNDAFRRKATCGESYVFTMTKVIKAPRSIRRRARDQRFATAPKLTKAEAKRIADQTYHRLKSDTGSEQFASEYRSKIERVLGQPTAW
jgi:hypothetical protein